jgi:hypothetical protein
MFIKQRVGVGVPFPAAHIYVELWIVTPSSLVGYCRLLEILRSLWRQYARRKRRLQPVRLHGVVTWKAAITGC